MYDNVVDVSTDLIHEVTKFNKQGNVPTGDKLVKMKVILK